MRAMAAQWQTMSAAAKVSSVVLSIHYMDSLRLSIECSWNVLLVALG